MRIQKPTCVVAISGLATFILVASAAWGRSNECQSSPPPERRTLAAHSTSGDATTMDEEPALATTIADVNDSEARSELSAESEADFLGDVRSLQSHPNGRGLTPRTHPDRLKQPDAIDDLGARTEAATTSALPITFHGGHVVTGVPNVYFVWYGTTSSSTMSVLTDFVRALTNSPWASMNRTYYDGAGVPASTSFVLRQAAYDLDYSRGKVITDSQVQDIVFAQIRAGRLPLDGHGLYFLFTAADVRITSGFGTEYCGYHTFGVLNGTPIRYALVGNPRQFGDACMAQTGSSPNDNPPADAMASILAHELTEMITDPLLNAWYDAAGQENADKCDWTFGSTFVVPNGSLANMTIGGRNFLIQRNWLNVGAGRCSLRR